MTAAAQTSEPTNPSTGQVRLLAALRWLVLLLYVHRLIVGARKMAAALSQGADSPDFPIFANRFGTDDPAVILARVTRALRRAVALKDELLATSPTDPRLTNIAHRRAMGTVVIDICRDLGIYRTAPTRALNLVQRRVFPPAVGLPATNAAPATFPQPTACPGRRTGATGPPPLIHRGDAESAEIEIHDAGVPWRFSRRAPASFSLYALS